MALSVEGLAVIRGERRLFKDLSFSLAAGEAMLLRGPNGSGKSSLLRLLAGFLAPAAGTIAWQGRPLAEAEDFRAAALYLGHQDAVKPQFTTEQNLAYAGCLLGLDNATAEMRAGEVLDAAGLGRQRRLPARYLSAGQKRRLALCRLLLMPAKLWLLDEPTNALDSAAIDWLGRALADHRAQGGAVLLASHVPVPLPDAQALLLPEGKLAKDEPAGDELT